MSNFNYEAQISTPEAAVKIGRVLGVRQNNGIGIGSDGDSGAALIADAIRCGAMYCGSNIYNFGTQNMPIMRSAVRFCRNDYGVYVRRNQAIDRDEISVIILDRYGIELSREQIEVLFKHGIDETSSAHFGVQKMLPEFKTYYIRHIINSVKSEEFKVNFNLTTSLKAVSDVLNAVLSEFYGCMKEGYADNYEFGGEIIDGGDRIILKRSNGDELTEEQTLLVMTYVLLHDSSVRTFILPESVSRTAEDAILKQGGSVIRTDSGRRQRMEKMIEYAGLEQLMMEFDGVYAAVRILDFINRFNMSFDDLVDKLPRIFKAEAEVECGEENIKSIISGIKLSSRDSAVESGNGIKLQTGGGIAVVVPKGTSGIIKVISEAESIEAAEEISAELKDKIKMMVKTK